MHGRRCEERKTRQHMLAVSSSIVDDDSFFKDGRKISVGECALFQAGDSPPFIGIIRSLISGKEDYLKLCVNWLYRPADIKLGKGVLLDAAPNELFYSFHKDEILSASLLHPCKVAFLCKGVELPSGISSFVCRRVYDIANKCLWWLTDQDYINERQQEVDKLLEKTQAEMHAAVQSGGRSPKSLNGPTSSQQVKHQEGIQNNATSIPSHIKGKKRSRSDQGQGLEPIKQERPSNIDDADSAQRRPENMIKLEIGKITDKRGLINIDGVEKLINLMQLDRTDRKVDLPGKITLAEVIAITDRSDCLSRFVQLRGLPIFDDWLQEAHKGRTGDGNSPKDGDKSVEELLLVMLRALDKLPVNLHALQTCNIGKSVNNLRSHKNMEIQKKARSLVDTWKKRVDAEMKISDAKCGSNQVVSWPVRQGFPEVSPSSVKRVGSSETATKSVQSSASKVAPNKPGHGDTITKSTPASPGSIRSASPLLTLTGANSKDLHSKVTSSSGVSELPLTTVKEEKSSSSSQSLNNSQSCSSDHGKSMVSAWKEDARSSTAGSLNSNKISNSNSSRHRRTNNGHLGSVSHMIDKESSVVKPVSANKNAVSDKGSHSGLTSERALETTNADNGINQRLIVRLPNPVRSPARSGSGGSFEDPSIVGGQASSPIISERHDPSEHQQKGRIETSRASMTADVNAESWQSNDMKDGLASCDEGVGSPAGALDEEQSRNTDKTGKVLDASKTSSPSTVENCISSAENELGKQYDTSFSPMNALLESCKYTESNAPISVEDDLGMNLLASVAAGEISKSNPLSPSGGNVASPNDSRNDLKAKLSQDGDASQVHITSDGTQGEIVKKPEVNEQTLLIVGPASKVEHSEQVSTMDSTQISNACLKSDGKSGEDSIEKSIREVTNSLVTEEDGLEKKSLVGDNTDDTKSSKRKSRYPTIEGKRMTTRAQNKILEMRKGASDNVASTNVTDTRGTTTSSKKNDKEVVSEAPSRSKHIDNDNRSVVEGAHPVIQREQHLPDEHRQIKSSEVAANGGDRSEGPSTCNNAMFVENDGKPLSGNVDAVDIPVPSKVTSNEDRDGLHLGDDTFDPNKNIGDDRNLEREDVNANPLGGLIHSEQFLPRSDLDHQVQTSASKIVSKADDNTNDGGSITTGKLDFDLNEGLMDDGSHGDHVPFSTSTSIATHFIDPHSQFSAPNSSGFSAPITVAAAAKGPFLSSNNLLTTKGELGWRGSAARSAFRPAEPRKILDMPLSAAESLSSESASVGKSGRAPLDIDLNVADERVPDDLGYFSSIQEKTFESTSRNEIFSSLAPVRSAGGLDLDLNRVDDSSDNVVLPSSTNRKSDVSIWSGKASSSSIGFPHGENVPRSFDLNNGPGIDEINLESASRSENAKSSSVPFVQAVPGMRINNSDLGNMTSWFPAGNSYPAVSIPPFLPERGEQPYQVVAPAGSQRIVGPISGGTFSGDLYRGPVLSSSPAMAAFPYNTFPFGSSFPLASTSYSGGSTTYVDSASAVGSCFPAIPSQLVGPGGAVLSHYPRPYVIIPEASSTGAIVDGNRKWGKHGLDLNAGPGGDVEGRDERLHPPPRQFSVASSQASTEEQQARIYQSQGGLKRKEPENGWDLERFGYKQPSWK